MLYAQDVTELQQRQRDEAQKPPHPSGLQQAPKPLHASGLRDPPQPANQTIADRSESAWARRWFISSHEPARHKTFGTLARRPGIGDWLSAMEARDGSDDVDRMAPDQVLDTESLVAVRTGDEAVHGSFLLDSPWQTNESRAGSRRVSISCRCCLALLS